MKNQFQHFTSTMYGKKMHINSTPRIYHVRERDQITASVLQHDTGSEPPPPARKPRRSGGVEPESIQEQILKLNPEALQKAYEVAKLLRDASKTLLSAQTQISIWTYMAGSAQRSQGPDRLRPLILERIKPGKKKHSVIVSISKIDTIDKHGKVVDCHEAAQDKTLSELKDKFQKVSQPLHPPLTSVAPTVPSGRNIEFMLLSEGGNHTVSHVNDFSRDTFHMPTSPVEILPPNSHDIGADMPEEDERLDVHEMIEISTFFRECDLQLFDEARVLHVGRMRACGYDETLGVDINPSDARER
ncbi:hypothetical protein FPCIR_11581 [Fusarium pseudocircinatum]|uniref:Uncharacterized protein n=1 Tax=Fusarium pseudocircinatum TaxID=56676 RepID=A0A8H5NT85_9HYPO|nr:hypothetical protein FPCIR_11581 [Fusarium pseudocircinatum]